MRFNHGGLPVYDPPCRWPTPGNELAGLYESRWINDVGRPWVSRVPQDPVRPNCPPRVHTKFEAKRARVPNAADTKLRSRVPGGSPFKSGRASFGPQLSSLRDTFVTDCDFDGALIAKKEKKKKGRKKWRECKK